MNIYSKKQKWKWLLLIAATCIVASSLWVSSHLVHKISISEKRNVELWAEAVKRKALMKEATYQLYAKIKREEKKKVKLWAEANRLFPQIQDNNIAFGFVFEVIRGNETVPVMMTDASGKILFTRNLDPLKAKDSVYLIQELDEMRRQHDSIQINLNTESAPSCL